MKNLSQMNIRRLKIFKSYKRAYFSFIFLCVSFFLSLFADFIFNNKPLIVSYNKEYYFPVIYSYPETTFGGFFETETDYKDSDIQEVLSQNGNWMLFPPFEFSPTEVDFNLSQPAPSTPDLKHWLGTDDRARDVLARLVFGFRTSLFFGFLIAFLGTLIGIVIGGLQGFFGGFVDLVGQRVIEVWASLPELFILIILTSIFEPSVYLLTILMAAMGWVGLAAYVRAEFLRAREFDFVQSANALGASKLRIMLIHILPNTLAPVITFLPFRVSAAITGLAALDFLGLGVPVGVPSLGELLSQGKNNLHSWWIILSTFFVMVTVILCLNFIGEGVQKAMDPKALEK